MKRILLTLLLLLLLPAVAEASEKSYIVVYKSGVSIQHKVQELRADKTRVPRVYNEVFPGAQVLLSDQEYKELREDPRVRLIEPDGLAHKTLAWGLDRIDQRTLPLSGSYNPPSTGAGTRAYIVDTGIRSDHQEFRGRILPGKSVISDGRGSEDCDGHGTHVAGTVAGSTFGVAPGANIVPVRVLDCDGSGSWSGIIDALDWIIANNPKDQVAVANMSLGGSRLESVNAAVERLVAAGVRVAVAAGNENTDACYSSPASAEGAWTVGSTTSADSRSSFSNWGSCVDIWAPGSGILSAYNRSASDSATLSGTSMASPHVAGALLLLGDEAGEKATTGILSGLGAGSPNRMLYLGTESQPPPPQGPGNDNFAAALPLQRDNTSTTVRATRESGEPRHVHSLSGSENSIWYRWTAPLAGTVTLSTEGSNFDTLLAVYRGDSLRDLSRVAANDDGAIDFTSRVGFMASRGTTYYVAVDGYGGRTGGVQLQHLYVPLEVGISTGPPEKTRSSTAEFTFSGTECSLDDAAWSTCTSPLRLENLEDGTHVFRVRYEDEVHSWTWTIDSTPPITPVISKTPQGFGWAEEVGSQSFCALGASEPTPCSSPVEFPGLRPGEYLLRVWQEDELGNRSAPGSITFTISNEAESSPLQIIKAPPRQGAPRKALFVFQGAGDYMYRLDRGSWRDCTSPLRLRGLRPGRHRLLLEDQSGAQLLYVWRVGRK